MFTYFLFVVCSVFHFASFPLDVTRLVSFPVCLRVAINQEQLLFFFKFIFLGFFSVCFCCFVDWFGKHAAALRGLMLVRPNY